MDVWCFFLLGGEGVEIVSVRGEGSGAHGERLDGSHEKVFTGISRGWSTWVLMDSALKLPSGVTHGDEASLYDSGVKQKKYRIFLSFFGVFTQENTPWLYI